MPGSRRIVIMVMSRSSRPSNRSDACGSRQRFLSDRRYGYGTAPFGKTTCKVIRPSRRPSNRNCPVGPTGCSSLLIVQVVGIGSRAPARPALACRPSTRCGQPAFGLFRRAIRQCRPMCHLPWFESPTGRERPHPGDSRVERMPASLVQPERERIETSRLRPS